MTKKLIAIVLLLFFLGCATTPKRVEETPVVEQQEAKEETAVKEIKSGKELKEVILKSHIYQSKGKIIFYSDDRKNSQEIKKRLIKQFPNALSSEDLGFEGYKKESIVSQIDGRNAPLFVSIESKKGDEIILEIISIESGEKESHTLLCSFLDNEKSHSEFVMNVFSKPQSLSAWSGKEIFVWDGKKIALINLDEKSEKTADIYICEGAFLSNFGEGAVCFCPQSGKGAKLIMKNGVLEKAETSGFPFPERVLRFINVEKDENGNWFLSDRKGDVLGQFINLSRYVFMETSIFLAISPNGQLWGLRGDLIQPIYSKDKILVKSIASSEQIAYALSQNGDLYKISIDNNFSIALSKKNVDFSEEIANIAVVGNELYAFAKGENSFKLYRIYQNGD
ncbi:MAG: hypothetical protein N2445_06870 [Acidobacteria bacterium]|nr:hypothetical protein [Acidobacteriota bacterium]